MGALATVGCRPYYPPGKPRSGASEGYETVVLRKQHLAYHLGIRQGDIIRKVNEKEIVGKQSALDIFQEVQTADKVEVNITREGKDLTFTYIIQYELLEPTGS